MEVLELSVSPQDQDKNLSGGIKVPNQSQKDILMKSISNFREYDRMKEHFEKEKSRVLESKGAEFVRDEERGDVRERNTVKSQIIQNDDIKNRNKREE